MRPPVRDCPRAADSPARRGTAASSWPAGGRPSGTSRGCRRLQESRSQRLRRRAEGTHRALPPLIMIRLLRMARHAQGPVRYEPSDERRRVAGIAPDVRLDRWRVRGADLRGIAVVARRATATARMVVVMTGGARDGLGIGIQCDGRRMTGYALQCAVLEVIESRRVVPAWPARYGHLHGDRFRSQKLGRAVTGVAVARLGRLMMTDLAAARRLKREPAALAPGRVTGDAGKRLVARVGKRVGGGAVTAARGGGGALRRRVVKKRPVSLAFPGSMTDPGRKPGVHGDPLQGLGRVERQRGIEPLAGAALLHRRVAPGAVARVHLRVMGLVAQDAGLGGGRGGVRPPGVRRAAGWGASGLGGPPRRRVGGVWGWGGGETPPPRPAVRVA